MYAEMTICKDRFGCQGFSDALFNPLSKSEGRFHMQTVLHACFPTGQCPTIPKFQLLFMKLIFVSYLVKYLKKNIFSGTQTFHYSWKRILHKKYILNVLD